MLPIFSTLFRLLSMISPVNMFRTDAVVPSAVISCISRGLSTFVSIAKRKPSDWSILWLTVLIISPTLKLFFNLSVLFRTWIAFLYILDIILSASWVGDNVLRGAADRNYRILIPPLCLWEIATVYTAHISPDLRSLEIISDPMTFLLIMLFSSRQSPHL